MAPLILINNEIGNGLKDGRKEGRKDGVESCELMERWTDRQRFVHVASLRSPDDDEKTRGFENRSIFILLDLDSCLEGGRK